jgi:hypothetical protein
MTKFFNLSNQNKLRMFSKYLPLLVASSLMFAGITLIYFEASNNKYEKIQDFIQTPPIITDGDVFNDIKPIDSLPQKSFGILDNRETSKTISKNTENITSGINLESIVALNCHYMTASGEVAFRGSGVIVNPSGFILTSRHLINRAWASWAYGTPAEREIIEFKYCEVGWIEFPNTTINPPFPYIAKIYFEPKTDKLSTIEYQMLDFAVLKISQLNQDCHNTQTCKNNLPLTFPYSPIIYNSTPSIGENLLNYGFPIDSETDNFSLKRMNGPLKTYYSGDRFFADRPLIFEWTVYNLLPGQSGSPVFWNGYVAGLVYYANPFQQAMDYVLGVPAIYQILEDYNLQRLISG